MIEIRTQIREARILLREIEDEIDDMDKFGDKMRDDAREALEIKIKQDVESAKDKINKINV